MDYIILAKQENGAYKPVTFSDGDIVIYGDKNEAINDMTTETDELFALLPVKKGSALSKVKILLDDNSIIEYKDFNKEKMTALAVEVSDKVFVCINNAISNEDTQINCVYDKARKYFDNSSDLSLVFPSTLILKKWYTKRVIIDKVLENVGGTPWGSNGYWGCELNFDEFNAHGIDLNGKLVTLNKYIYHRGMRLRLFIEIP